MKGDELLPCPFCGGRRVNITKHSGSGTGYIHAGEDVFSVGCYDCGASVPNRYSRKRLVEAWNRRESAKDTGIARWDFDPLSGYILFCPDNLTRVVVAELHSSGDNFGKIIADGMNSLNGNFSPTHNPSKGD